MCIGSGISRLVRPLKLTVPGLVSKTLLSCVFKTILKSGSKYKAKHTEAIQTYNDMRSIAKTKIEQLVRFHQPQEDVDTIRSHD